jgi:TonB family protein
MFKEDRMRCGLAARVTLLAVCCSAASWAAGTGSVSGAVLDGSNQKPLADATVVIRTGKAPTGEEPSVTTDENGAFELTFIAPGTYGLTVKHDGYQVYSPDGLVVKADKSVKVKLFLTPVRREPPPQSKESKAKGEPPPPSAPVETAVEFNDSMVAPSMISGPPIEYSQDAIDREVEGVMLVKCVVTAQGTVRSCLVIRSLPFMDRPVVDSLERRKYKPALEKGKPIDVFYTFNVKLALPSASDR